MQDEEEEPEEGEPIAEEVLAAAALAHRQERAVARELLARERATLAGVREAVAAGTDTLVADIATDARGAGLTEDAQARRARLKIIAAVPVMTSRLTRALTKARAGARAGGLELLEDDLGRDIRVPDDGTDQAHSYAAAATLTAAWAGYALRGVDPKQAGKAGGLAIAVRRTPLLLQSRIRLIAATETAEAFNDERAGALVVLAKEMPGPEEGTILPALPLAGPYRSAPVIPIRTYRAPAPVVRLVKVWSALLDGAVCRDCREMHGTAIEAGDTFIGGDPPLHPHCRCIFILIATAASLDEFERAYDEMDEAA